MSDKVCITYVRSSIGCSLRQKRTIRALGFHRLNESRIFQDSKSLRGMLKQVAHLVEVKPIVDSQSGESARITVANPEEKHDEQ